MCNELCILCKKQGFGDANGCLSSKVFTPASGDWVCKAGCDGSVIKSTDYDKSITLRAIPIFFSHMKNRGEFLAVKTVRKDKTVVVSITFHKERFVYRAIEYFGCCSFSITHYDAQDIKNNEVCMSDIFDASRYFNLIDEAIDILFNG